ncbi:MAG: YbhB/YbcL family Raf kinase inhibitor-like protein [Xanthomonadales bacterium]|nr:YbhB/YbcL family Raf kinase inhibitor-like protein [Xanthomonadales bacterium]
MRIHSENFRHGHRLPAAFAAGVRDDQGVGFGANRNPHLAWTDVPAGTASFALMCVDPDAPTVPEMVGRDDVEIPAQQPRTAFTHWLVADLPATLREIAEGSCSDGVVKGGKREPSGPAGSRQGLNDYTGWFAGDPALAGDWFGYDGPFPPPNDLRLHRYEFRLLALDVARLDLPARYTRADLEAAVAGHVLAEASTYATYSLHPGLAD